MFDRSRASVHPPGSLGMIRRSRTQFIDVFRAVRPFARYALRRWARVLLGLVALTASSAATLAVPYALREMIDSGFSRYDVAAINTAFSSMIGIVSVLALAVASRYYLVTTLGDRIAADLRNDLFAHVVRLDAAFFDRAKSGDILSRLIVDVGQIRTALSTTASVALRNLAMLVGAVALTIAANPRLAAVALAATPFVVAPLVAIRRPLRRRSRTAQDTLAAASAIAVEQLGAIRLMQACCAERYAIQRFSDAVHGNFLAARELICLQALLNGLAVLAALGGVVVVLYLGAQEVISGATSPGELSQFVIFALLGATSVSQLSEIWNEISASAGAVDRIAELLEVKPLVFAPASTAQLPSPVRGEIKFERVVFSYRDTRSHEIDDISFTVAAGETVAIVGASGSGKSTIVQLLMRFYDPAAGAIYLDDIDIRTLDPTNLRARIALVPQDPVVFAESVFDNIAYGRPGATMQQVNKAARGAAADDFIATLNGGYSAICGERGVTLSGGQRQRLAMARALLKDAPILVLDEATSALDAQTERKALASLAAPGSRRTTVVVAHRLATIRNADRILVMDNGRIVESGRHDDLLVAGGPYARLVQRQDLKSFA